ncbi:unnamed protein product [Rotaria sp. Silwood1]|nr:unnamed protein product [Rotaria sp. Silwood1]CAF4561963.1 unnamed protein product [Rotaria sp. Silwood1]CAF4575697.1 unnamed protein product [Rotaria sp. Silwood1]CAF4636016.1 unnamed protein product [Rotaria sp. Silwood1]
MSTTYCCEDTIQQICVCFHKSLCSTLKCSNSLLTRVVYDLILTLTVIAACSCFNIDQTGTTNTCESFAGYADVHRIF